MHDRVVYEGGAASRTDAMSTGQGRTDPSAARSRYGAQIYWQETVARPPVTVLGGDARADVAIVGGGFTGLWTAVYLKRADPQLEVVVLEAEEIAFGGSGRNTGNAITKLDRSLAHLESRLGLARARILFDAVAGAVDEIGRVCEEAGIDCDYRKTGWLNVATNPGQEQRLRVDFEAGERIGIEGLRLLSRDEIRARVNSPTYLAGLFNPASAVVNPTQLAVGLARHARELGVRVYEDSAVRGWERATRHGELATERGRVTAQQIVIATNAWQPPCMPRVVTPVYSYIVATAPLSDAQWETVGWKGFETVLDKRNYFHYARRTADGRILWGGSDARYHFGSRIAPSLDSHGSTEARLGRTFHETFPQLGKIGFTHAWGGPVAITGSFHPCFGSVAGGRIHYGVGYCGHGVAVSNLGGRILRDLVLRRDTDETHLPLVGDDAYRMPAEPLRWFGASVTRSWMRRQDRSLDRGRGVAQSTHDPLPLRALDRLSGHGRKPH
jgi:glycine/D-amino acid oxidase-like deaminating enzyme